MNQSKKSREKNQAWLYSGKFICYILNNEILKMEVKNQTEALKMEFRNQKV